MKKVFYIIIILLLVYYFFRESSKKSEKFGSGKENDSTKVVLYQDYRREDPGYIYDSPGKLDVMLNINLRSAEIKTGNRTVEIWKIWDSPNSNSTSINSDFYSYIVPYAMRSNPGKYDLVAKLDPNTEKKIDFTEQINRIRLVIW